MRISLSRSSVLLAAALAVGAAGYAPAVAQSDGPVKLWPPQPLPEEPEEPRQRPAVPSTTAPNQSTPTTPRPSPSTTPPGSSIVTPPSPSTAPPPATAQPAPSTTPGSPLVTPPSPPATAQPTAPTPPAPPTPTVTPSPQPPASEPDEDRQVRSIESESLPDLDADSVGLLGDAGDGLGHDMWAGTQRNEVVELLARLPAAPRSRVARQLMRRLLLTRAAAPQGTSDGPSLSTLRAEALAAMGEIEALGAFVDLVPPAARDARLLQAAADGALMAGDRPRACSLAREALEIESTLGLQQLLIFCQMTEGNKSQAQLALNLLREQGIAESDPFVVLMKALGGDRSAEVHSMPKPTLLLFSMLRAADQPLPGDALAGAGPGVLVAIARSDAMEGAVRLHAAERAALLGALLPEDLAELYGRQSFNANAFNDPLAAAKAGYGPETRALLYQAMRRQNGAQQRAALAADGWQLAVENGAPELFALSAAPLVGDIQPGADLAGYAGAMTRILLLGGRNEAASAWYRSLTVDPGAPPLAAAELWALARLSGQADVSLEGAARDRWVAFTQEREHGDERVALAYALLTGLDEVGGTRSEWVDVISTDVAIEVGASVPSGWRRVRSSASVGRRGEAVLRFLVALGERDLVEVAQTEPAGLRIAVRALRRTGLTREARALAVEAAVASGL